MNWENKTDKERAIEYLGQRIGAVSRYKKIKKPEYCEICKRDFDNYEWHYKLSHTNFKESIGLE